MGREIKKNQKTNRARERGRDTERKYGIENLSISTTGKNGEDMK